MVVQGGFDILTNQDFGQKGKQIHTSNTRPHQTPWQKVCENRPTPPPSAKSTSREVAQEATEKAEQGQSEVLDFATLRLPQDPQS